MAKSATEINVGGNGCFFGAGRVGSGVVLGGLGCGWVWLWMGLMGIHMVGLGLVAWFGWCSSAWCRYGSGCLGRMGIHPLG